MSDSDGLPDGLIAYGPNANCTLALCPIEASIYQYRPSLGANATFLALFAIAMFAHIWRGIKYREFTFFICMVLGCLAEIIGYAGRLIMWNNPFSFIGFIVQICCITFAPVFYCAAIYILLARVIVHLDASLSRLPIAFWYWFFIPCDLISLTLQATGGALSSTSSGDDTSGVTISQAGLGLQVGTLGLFIIGCLDYAWRYRSSPVRQTLTPRFKWFLAFTGISIILIFIRCGYRIYELNQGYSGPAITNQGEFIGLESVMIVISAFTLLGANPGPVVAKLSARKRIDADGEKNMKDISSSEGEMMSSDEGPARV